MDILNDKSYDIKELLSALDEMLSNLEYTLKHHKLPLGGEQYLTNRDLCALLKISTQTLQDYRDKGYISFVKLDGKILYKSSDVELFLNTNYVKAIP